MPLIKCKLGELIELVDERNLDGLRNFYGVNIDKEFIPTVADTSTLNEKKYKVVRKNRFACNLMHVGRDVAIPIAFHQSDEPIIVSPAYFTFEVTATDKILPEYFFMLFRSKEKDRLGWFLSDSSVRANLEWKTFCDIEINLPPLSVQKKFIAVYNALLENKKAYERGLDDLKLVCDGYIENLRRNMPREKIGNYIELIDERNADNLYTTEDVRGLGTTKEIITTKADLDGVNLENYKVVQPEQFAYVADTSRRGDKISLAHNMDDKIFLVSSISIVFSTDAEKLLPQYLMLFFNRSEFDRYARFHSWGSAREVFTWKDLCEVEVPIPDIKIQQSIAAIYEVLRTRKKILERLKTQIKNICPILIKGSLDEGATT